MGFRESEKKERERALAERNLELQRREERVQDIIRAQDDASLPAEEVLTMAELQLAGDYHEALRGALIQQRLLVLEAVEAVDEAREAFMEKSREVKTLSSLKDKRFEEFKDETRREEKKTLDEMTVQKVGRKS